MGYEPICRSAFHVRTLRVNQPLDEGHVILVPGGHVQSSHPIASQSLMCPGLSSTHCRSSAGVSLSKLMVTVAGAMIGLAYGVWGKELVVCVCVTVYVSVPGVVGRG